MILLTFKNKETLLSILGDKSDLLQILKKKNGQNNLRFHLSNTEAQKRQRNSIFRVEGKEMRSSQAAIHRAGGNV